MQLVSNPKVNHPEPLSLQIFCNHSLWSQICMSTTVHKTRIFGKENAVWCI